MDNRLNTFVATDGTVLHLRPVREIAVLKRQNIIEAELRKEGLPLDPPTRIVVALGGKGDAEEIPLTEQTLEVRDNPEETARNIAKWRAHENALVKLHELQQEERYKTMLALGVEVEGGVPEAETWRDQLEYLGVELPTHPLDVKAYYLMFVLLNDYDLNTLISQIQMLGAGKAVTAEQVETFQETVQSTMGEAINSLVQSAKERLEKLRVERTSETVGDEDGEDVGPDA